MGITGKRYGKQVDSYLNVGSLVAGAKEIQGTEIADAAVSLAKTTFTTGTATVGTAAGTIAHGFTGTPNIIFSKYGTLGSGATITAWISTQADGTKFSMQAEGDVTVRWLAF